MKCGRATVRSATAARFDYSPALESSRLMWNEKTLDRWLTNPEAAIPGQKMGFKVSEAADRADIIKYLRTAK